ncbi:hypothetical protein GFS24_00720 [Chitinophaga sp. SYP-B3965]|uniref:hypothetical protein n=1 Tax=Chitinophaga sp. SYP-B3965 TaxID=2663120 RepID=UPI0012998071|nr:hypothetical protein [Chitinophaga sp. SYP-B3965]MRG43612.1 hypothetical protein [Chitinophaga sp. SYP-B3965]
MKPMIYSAIAALLVLSSCSTAYQTAQTPDDVYYSPGKAKVYANNTARSTRQEASNAADEETYNDNGDDNYVTYQDEDEERYDYARRIDRFSRGYNGYYWDGYYADQFYGGGPSLFMNNYYGFGGYPSWGNSFSIGLGWGYNPYRWNNFYGSGWYGGGFYGNPWYNNWYGGSGWYGGGGYYPGGGWHGGGGGYYNPRPTNSWGPRGSSSSRVFNSNGYNPSSPRPNTTGSTPRRVFDRSGGNVVNPGNPNGGRVNNGGVPRRTFDSAPTERPAARPGTDPGSRPSRSAPVRNYDRSNDQPVRQSSPEPTYRAPAPERSAPERSYPSSSPSSSPSNNSPSPSRQSSPRRGG